MNTQGAPQQQQPPPMEAYGSDMSYQQQPMGPADIAIGIVLQFGFDLIQRAIASPTDRLVLLSTVEGELKQQGRLPPATGFGGIMRLVKRIYRKEGFSGFFRGVLTDSVLAFPTMFIDALSTNLVFTVLQMCLPTQVANALGPVEVALLSIGATWAAVMVASPINAVRKTISTNYVADIVAPAKATEADVEAEGADETEGAKAGATAAVQEEGYRYGNAQECAKTMYKYGGWRAFYRGALVDPLTMCVYRGLYAATSMGVPAYYQIYHPYAVARLMAIAADIATQPFEVICRRLTLTASADADEALANSANSNDEQKTEESAQHRYRYNGALDCVQTVMREEGWQALFAGLRCRLVMTAGSMVLRAGLNALNGGGGDQAM